MPAPCRVPRVPSLWGRQTGQAKRKAQHVQEGGRSPQRGGVSGLLANGMAHGRGRLRVAVLVGGGALAPEAPVAVGTPGGWLAGLGGALAFRVCGAAGLTACLPSQSRTTVSPGTTSCTRRTAKAAPTCWWSTPPPGASAARWTCSWPRPSSSRYPWPPGRDVRAQPTRHRPAVALCSWSPRLGDIATCQLAFTRAAFCAAVARPPITTLAWGAFQCQAAVLSSGVGGLKQRPGGGTCFRRQLPGPCGLSRCSLPGTSRRVALAAAPPPLASVPVRPPPPLESVET